jgi:enediyne biosynthesis protein E4
VNLLSRATAAAATIGAAVLLSGCGAGQAARVEKMPPAAPIVFEDITRQAGIDFRHTSGATGKKYMPETMGAGCALFDVDNDGWLDALLVDSSVWPGEKGPEGSSRLYRNTGGGRFVDATERYGLPRGLYGMGVAAGDFDNDGFTDLFITALDDSRLLRNVKGERFEDVSRKWRVRTPGWPTSAAWVDFNRDGRLDLFVCHYVRWSRETDVFFSLDGDSKSYARPDSYSGEPCQLLENRGNRFADVSAAAGIANANAKALGVSLCDFDRDGWVDLTVSNDTVPNFLFHNQGRRESARGAFKEVGVQAGMAVAEGGRAKAGMGIDTADYDNTGHEAILITNFAGEQLSLYRRDASGLFMDVAARSGIGTPSQRYLGFGTFFFDPDLDGQQDIFVANGHIQDDVSVRSSGVTYAQPALLFRGMGQRRFLDVSSQAGALTVPRVGRGAACGDIDRDGDLDVLMTTNGGNGGQAVLLRQAGAPRNHWLRLRLEGSRANRSAIGASVRVRAGELVQSRMVRSGSSYLSQSALELTFGLGAGKWADEIEVRWPTGTVEAFPAVPADQEVTLVEGLGSR